MSSAPQPTTESVCRWVIENQPRRAEALFLQHLHDTPSKAILELLATPLPSLRLLSVDGQWQCYDALDDKMPAILGGGALGLRALMWSLAIPFIPGNAFLDLADLNITFADKNVLTLDRLLRLLSNCPRLETLNLKQSTFDVTTGIMLNRRPVALDHLRALWIQSMSINAALATLAHLQLPQDTTVRLSELTRFPPDPFPPRARIPFLQQMDDLASLDLVASKGRLQPFFHLVAVGARSRFWIHFDLDSTGVGGARAYVRHLCGMLPTKSLRTLRVSVADVADLVVIRDVLLDSLPSLDTLLMRHSTTATPAEAASGIAAVSKALCPGGGPEDIVKGSDTDSDEYVPGDGLDSDTDSDSSSGTDSNSGSDDGDPVDAAGQSPSPDTPDDSDTAFPVDTSAAVPAPHLKVVGLQVKCGGDTASFESFAHMLAARKQSSRPLDTVLCSFEWVEAKDVDDMKECVVGGVRDVLGALWVPTIDEGWRVRNDYWRLYPDRRDDCDEADYLEWGFFMTIW